MNDALATCATTSLYKPRSDSDVTGRTELLQAELNSRFSNDVIRKMYTASQFGVNGQSTNRKIQFTLFIYGCTRHQYEKCRLLGNFATCLLLYINTFECPNVDK